MSANKRRGASKRAFPKAEDTKPALRLVRPSSEGLTPDRALDPSREVKEMLQKMNGERQGLKENDAPDAA